MTRRVFIIRNNVTTDISDGSPFTIQNIFNLGAADATRITERSPAQHGDTDLDYRLQPRIIQIVLQAVSGAYSYSDVRALANSLFRGTNTSLILGVEFDDGTLRYIDVYGVGALELPFNLLSTLYQNIGVRLRAANPLFYDPVGKSQSFGIAGGGSAFTIPSFVPTFFGINALDQSIPIEYGGTFREFPVILLYGPITDPVIENVTTGLKLDFTGYTVASGDIWTIDMRYGRKQIYNNGDPTDTQLYKLSSDSNIANFALEADPDVVDGINVLRVTGTGLTTLTQVYIQYFHRFDGI